jgi:RND family efflux transporter MFP subunit
VLQTFEDEEMEPEMDAPSKTGTPAQPSLLWRGLRGAARLSVTVAIVASALLAVRFGSDELARRAEAAPAPAPAAILPVATVPIALSDGYQVRRAFVGQVEAQRSTRLSFELSGRLDEITVDEGDHVRKGQPIATLDARMLQAARARLQASQAALEAQLTFAEQTVQRQTRLRAKGASPQAALDEAISRADELRARIAEVAAQLDTNALEIEKSRVFAPFDGRVTERLVDGGESLSPGQALVEIVEEAAPLVRMGVPLDVTPEALSTARIEVGGAYFAARLASLRPDVDPVTRTRTALFQVAERAALTFGQTARLELAQHVEAPGLWVDTTALKEGARGQWTLLVVDDGNVVRALSVQVLHAEGDRVFVRGGFPPGLQLIAAGPQRVTVGQIVDPKPAT